MRRKVAIDRSPFFNVERPWTRLPKREQTQMAVDKIMPTQRPVEHRDTRLKGLVLRVTPGGAKSWYCELMQRA